MQLKIEIDADNEYTVTAFDQSWDLQAMVAKAHANLYPSLGVYDYGDGYVVLHRKNLVPTVAIDIERGIEVRSAVQFDGDDCLDGTLKATELSLIDRLEVAALIRELVL